MNIRELLRKPSHQQDLSSTTLTVEFLNGLIGSGRVTPRDGKTCPVILADEVKQSGYSPLGISLRLDQAIRANILTGETISDKRVTMTPSTIVIVDEPREYKSNGVPRIIYGVAVRVVEEKGNLSDQAWGISADAYVFKPETVGLMSTEN